MVDLDGLRDFMTRSEGADPPYFVGRQDEIDGLMSAAVQTWRHRGVADDGSLSKRTQIVHGAPGAGKSTLLRELARRLHATGTGKGQPRVLYANSADYTQDPDRFLAAIEMLAMLNPDRWKRRLQEVASRMSGSVSLGPVTIGIAGDGSANDRPRTIGQLHERLLAKQWQAPVVLAIDEFQNFESSSQSPEALQLKSMHEASYGLPVMLLLAGLGDTPARAREMGLTRVNTRHAIGRLTEDDVTELMTGFCQHFGMDPSRHESRLAALVESSDRWRRHIHFALQALAGAVLEVDGDLSRVDWPEVTKRNLELRQEYYLAQQSPAMRESAYLVAAVMQGLRKDSTRGALVNTIRLLSESNGERDTRWRTPDGETPSSFLGDLIHQGALQEDGKGWITSPIPSFRNFLERLGEPETEPVMHPGSERD